MALPTAGAGTVAAERDVRIDVEVVQAHAGTGSGQPQKLTRPASSVRSGASTSEPISARGCGAKGFRMAVGARSALAGAVIFAALGIPAPALAQAPTLPLEVRGVRVQSTAPGAVRITFRHDAERLYRRVAGRSLIVRCERVDATTGPLLLREDRGSELARTITAPRKRQPIALRQPGSSARFDVCRLVGGSVRGGRRNPRFVRRLSLWVPVTQPGALFLRDRSLGERMVAALDIIAALGRDGRYPAFAAASGVIPDLFELSAPDATPPARKLGLFTDAAQRLTVVAVTLTGRRLFIDANGEVLTSNVPEVVADAGD